LTHTVLFTMVFPHLTERRNKRSQDDAEIDITTSTSCQHSQPYEENDHDDDGTRKQQRPHKRVRFATNNDSQVVASEQQLGHYHYSDLEKQNLWWTRQERNGMNSRSRKIAKLFRKDRMDFVKHCHRVFHKCSQYPPSPSSNNYLETVTIIIPSFVRGLEWGIVPKIKAHRRTHADQVLQLQKQMERGHFGSDMRYSVLSTRAMRSSRPSRVMARLVGEGDAAILLLQEDEDENEDEVVVTTTTKPKAAIRPRMLLPLQR
jgi:hypothetical protein